MIFSVFYLLKNHSRQLIDLFRTEVNNSKSNGFYVKFFLIKPDYNVKTLELPL